MLTGRLTRPGVIALKGGSAGPPAFRGPRPSPSRAATSPECALSRSIHANVRVVRTVRCGPTCSLAAPSLRRKVGAALSGRLASSVRATQAPPIRGELAASLRRISAGSVPALSLRGCTHDRSSLLPSLLPCMRFLGGAWATCHGHHRRPWPLGMLLTEPAHDGRAQALDKSPQRFRSFHLPGGRFHIGARPGRFRTGGSVLAGGSDSARTSAAASKPRPNVGRRRAALPRRSRTCYPHRQAVTAAHAIPRGMVTDC